MYEPATGEVYISNDLYLPLQLVVFVFVCTITAAYFEETFRMGAVRYLGSFKLGVWRAVGTRYLRLLAFLEVLYLPFVTLSFVRANESITQNELLFEKVTPRINISIPLVQCAAAMVFYVTVTLFFQMILRNRVYTIVLLLGYCSLEVTCLRHIYQEFLFFRGAVGSMPIYTKYFPTNICMMLFLSTLMLAVVLFVTHQLYGERR